MTTQAFAALGCRLISVYYGLFSALLLARKVGHIPSYQRVFAPEPVGWIIASEIVPVALRLALAILLWHLADRLARLVSPNNTSASYTGQINARDLLVLGIFFSGVFLTIPAIASLGGLLQLFQKPPPVDLYLPGPIDAFSKPWSQILMRLLFWDLPRIALALLLIFRPRQIARRILPQHTVALEI